MAVMAVHVAGPAPLPYGIPCEGGTVGLGVYESESPKAVRRWWRIFWIVSIIDKRAGRGTPRWPRARMATTWITASLRGVIDGQFYPWFNRSHDGDSSLLDTNWPDRRFLSQVEINPVLFCEVACWVLHCVVFHLVPLVLMLCFVDNLDDYEEKKRSFGSLEKACYVQFYERWWWIVRNE